MKMNFLVYLVPLLMIAHLFIVFSKSLEWIQKNAKKKAIIIDKQKKGYYSRD
jgi:hypothetical protein